MSEIVCIISIVAVVICYFLMLWEKKIINNKSEMAELLWENECLLKTLFDYRGKIEQARKISDEYLNKYEKNCLLNGYIEIKNILQ